jgi:hypothetical protein
MLPLPLPLPLPLLLLLLHFAQGACCQVAAGWYQLCSKGVAQGCQEEQSTQPTSE